MRLTEHTWACRGGRCAGACTKRILSHGAKMWCIPPVDAEFVARMEECWTSMLNPRPRRPVVCFDESPTQLIGESTPVPGRRRARRPATTTDRRNGTANLFAFLDVHRPGATSKHREPGRG